MFWESSENLVKDSQPFATARKSFSILEQATSQTTVSKIPSSLANLGSEKKDLERTTTLKPKVFLKNEEDFCIPKDNVTSQVLTVFRAILELTDRRFCGGVDFC